MTVLGEWRQISTHSLTSALDGGEWSASHPGRFNPRGKCPWYPLNRRLGGPQRRSRRGYEEKNSQPLPGLEPRPYSPLPRNIPLSYPFTLAVLCWYNESELLLLLLLLLLSIARSAGLYMTSHSTSNCRKGLCLSMCNVNTEHTRSVFVHAFSSAEE
jgi:hypothetical protein